MTTNTKSDFLGTDMTDRSWMTLAFCRGVDTDRWFDAKPPKRVRQHIREVCSDCPVTRECLSYALVNTERHGAWGGRTMAEIRPLQWRLAAGEALSSVLNVGMQESGSSQPSDAA